MDATSKDAPYEKNNDCAFPATHFQVQERTDGEL